MALEPIAALFDWPDDELTEADFLVELLEATDAWLLLDIANVYANAVNRGTDPAALVMRLPLERVAYVHVAGGAEHDGLYHDTHTHTTPQEVLELLAELCAVYAPPAIEDMNRTNLAFSVFDGDIKNGSEPCYADAHTPTDKTTTEMAVADPAHPDTYKYALNLFGQFRDPVVVVPGDNEWTDCDRPAIVATSDSNDRLAYERRLFYPSNNSLGQRTIQQIRQSAAYPENVRWSQGPVTFIGLNIPGSDNNFADGGKNGPAAQGQAEYAARNAANLDWLRAGFAAAKAAHSRPACMPSRRRV